MAATDTYVAEKEIAKELTIAAISKLNTPLAKAGVQDHEKFAQTISEIYAIIYAEVKK